MLLIRDGHEMRKNDFEKKRKRKFKEEKKKQK